MNEGFTWSRIRSWLRSERLIVVFQGVYSFGRDIESVEAAWRAALLAAGPDAVLSSRSACELWGMVQRRGPMPRSIDLARPSGRTIFLKGMSSAMQRVRVKVTRRDLREDELRWKSGLPTTSPARSLIDFASVASANEVKFAFLEGCRLGYVVRKDVEYCFSRVAGRRGAPKLRPLLSLWAPELTKTRSVLEGLFLLAWAESGNEMPIVNERLFGFEVDCYWPEHRVVLELDGSAFHSDPVARRRDETRVRALEAQGVRVIRVTYREMRDDPDGAVARVEAFLLEC